MLLHKCKLDLFKYREDLCSDIDSKYNHYTAHRTKKSRLQIIAVVYPNIFNFTVQPQHLLFSPLWRCDPTRVMASSILRFLDHTQRRTTVGRTPLDEWSARRKVLYLTTHNTHNRQTSMPSVGFEPTISAGERPQTYALDRAATGTGFMISLAKKTF